MIKTVLNFLKHKLPLFNTEVRFISLFGTMLSELIKPIKVNVYISELPI